MPAASPSSRFLFVAGLHRSGTSMLRDLIAQHSAVSTLVNTNVIEDEGQHLQDVLPPPNTFGGVGKFAHKPAAHITEQDVAKYPDGAARMCASWAPYWSGGGELYVEKSPGNLARCRYLDAVFPNSRFVYILRNPIAVSYATQGLPRVPRSTMLGLLKHWAAASTLAERDAATLGEKAITIRYEELVARPAEILQQVVEHAGLPPQDLATGDVRSTGNDKYLQRWRERPEAVQKQLRKRLDDVTRVAAHFGYDLWPT